MTAGFRFSFVLLLLGFLVFSVLTRCLPKQRQVRQSRKNTEREMKRELIREIRGRFTRDGQWSEKQASLGWNVYIDLTDGKLTGNYMWKGESGWWWGEKRGKGGIWEVKKRWMMTWLPSWALFSIRAFLHLSPLSAIFDDAWTSGSGNGFVCKRLQFCPI